MSKKNKKIVTTEKAAGVKKPRNAVDPDNWLSCRPLWRFERADQGFDWDLFSANNLGSIIKKLIDFEHMTWSEVLKQTHDDGRSSNHFISPNKMIKKAQNRLFELKLDQHFDSIFSLRLNSTERLFGILEDGIFNILWYDNNHQICPSPKKHT